MFFFHLQSPIVIEDITHLNPISDPAMKQEKESLRYKGLESVASAKQLMIIDNNGQGNCQFKAIAHQLNLPHVDHMAVRRKAVSYLTDNPTTVRHINNI